MLPIFKGWKSLEDVIFFLLCVCEFGKCGVLIDDVE